MNTGPLPDTNSVAKFGQSVLRLSATVTQFAYYWGRQISSYTLGGSIGFMVWLKRHNPITGKSLAEYRITMAEVSKPLSTGRRMFSLTKMLHESVAYITYGANRRDELVNRNKKPLEQHTEGVSVQDTTLMSIKNIPEIVGAITLTYLATALIAAPIIYFLPLTWLVVLLLHTPYLLGVEPYGGDFINNLFKV